MVWETPCGLLADGRHFLNGYMSYQGVDWRPENGKPQEFPSPPQTGQEMSGYQRSLAGAE